MIFIKAMAKALTRSRKSFKKSPRLIGRYIAHSKDIIIEEDCSCTKLIHKLQDRQINWSDVSLEYCPPSS